MASGEFDAIITKSRPHILENICLSLDYNTFKNCLVINEAWKTVLTATAFQKKAKLVFREEILKDEERLRKYSEEGDTDEVRDLLSIGLLDVGCVDKHGGTPLHWAADNGHSDVVQLLLDGGADPNKEAEDGTTALHGAAYHGHKNVVQILLNRGADPTKTDQQGRTPMYWAELGGKDGVVNLLKRQSRKRKTTTEKRNGKEKRRKNMGI